MSQRKGTDGPLFSIVMPTYGVETYIAKAIECVLAQTCDDWELIVVDDASPDRSGEIAQRFASSDSRIRVLRHEENRWVGEARNTGIEAARGRYVWFPDPDDIYEPNLLELCADALSEHPADAVMFGHIEQYFGPDGNHVSDRPVNLPAEVLETQEQLRPRILEYEKLTCYGYPWNKVYSLDHIRERALRFTSDFFIEDIAFNVVFFQDARSLDVIPDVLYLYAKREASNITNSFKADYYDLHRKRIEMLTEQQRSWGILDDSARATLGSLMGRYVLSAIERNMDPRSGMDRMAQREWLQETFDDPLYRELVPYARSDGSRALEICLRPLRDQDARRALRIGRLIHFARGHMAGLFRRLRSER